MTAETALADVEEVDGPLPREAEAEEGDFGLFRLGGKTVAVHLVHLEEVARIEMLHPLIDHGGAALGMITVRGVLVPVIDPLGCYADGAARPEAAVILCVGGQFVALAVNEVMGIRRFPLRAIQRLAGERSQRLGAGTICDGAGLIHVIDVPAIFADGATPRAALDPRKTLRASRGLTTPLLTFLAGGVNFAVRADRIVGTVPRRSIEDVTAAGGPFLGTISYYNRRLPILASNLVFGIGAGLRPERFETVVLQFPDDRLVGLAAERIVRVVNSTEDVERALPVHLAHGVRMLRATVSFDAVIHFVIDQAELVADRELLSIAGLSDKELAPAGTAVGASGGAPQQKAVVFERERFLLAEAGTRLGIRITDIEAMRTPPPQSDILRTELAWPGFLGLYVLDGELVPLVHLAGHLGRRTAPNAAQARVMMSSDEGRPVAFLVDCLSGIGTSDWVTQQDEGGRGALAMASLKVQGQSEIRHIVDLRRLARDLLGYMTHQGAGSSFGGNGAGPDPSISLS